MSDDKRLPYTSASEYLNDELALVTMFVARAIARGRSEGWLEPGVHTIETSDAALVDRFRTIESRLALTERTLPMDLLRRRLELTLSEQRVLWTLVGYDLDPRLRRLIDYLATHERGGATLGTLGALLYSDARGPGYVELAPSGHLDALRLVEIESGTIASSHRRIHAVDRVIELATGIMRLDREIDRYAQLDDAPLIRPLVMDTALDEAVTALVRGAVESRTSPLLVLVGAVGAGRRSLARNAIGRAGLSLLSVDCEVLPTSTTELDRVLRSIFREARLFGAALLLENLDRLIEENGAARMRILDHAGLSTLPQPTIAIMSTECSVPSSRGVHSITLPPLHETSRIKLWRDALGSSGVSELPHELASRYHVTGGVIVNAAQRALDQARAEQRPLSADDVHHAIRGHVDTLLGGLGSRVLTSQNWEDVVLPSETFGEVHEMVARVKHRRQVFEKWGFAKGPRMRKSTDHYFSRGLIT